MSMISRLVSIFLLAGFALADIPSSISIATECKTCPYSICPNKVAYDSERPYMNLTCWTEGTQIVDDNTWLKTTDGCYVNQYDIKEYAGDYTTDLPYCGRIPQRITQERGRTRYYTECYYGARIYERAIRMYKYNINLDLTCVAPNVTGWDSEVMGKSKWYKTRRGCYVHGTTLWPVQNEDDLDDCGPIPRSLSQYDHVPETTTTSSVGPTPTPAPPSNATWHSKSLHTPRTSSHLARRFLYNTTIGEEYVNCTANSSIANRGRNIRVYEYNQTIIPQCGTVDGDSEIMLFTTDFCWIKDTECWVQLLESTLRSQNFPRCERFVDTVT